MSSRKRLKRRKKETISKVDSMSDFIVEEDDVEYDSNVYDQERCGGNEYFEIDSLPLQKELVNNLSKRLNVPHNELSEAIQEVFKSVSPYMIDDYFGARPSTNSWKVGEDPKIVGKIEKDLDQIREEMDQEIPTIPKIMSANITKDDKKRCIRLFDQMQNSEPFTSDYFRLGDEINGILGKSHFYSKKEVTYLEKEEEKLKNLFVSKDNLKTKILKLDADVQIKAQLLSQYEEMISYPSDSPLHSSLRDEISWAIKLPYQKREIDPYFKMNNVTLNKFYCQVRKKLDEELYGMEVVKDRIIHILNDRRASGDECGRNIALVGNPGTGKSQICKVLAKILNKKFAKISAGALDSAAIKGSNRVWSGSEPSIILQILASLKTNNAILMFDEVDKLGDTPQGKLAQNALLHVSDTADNKEFQDNYLKNFTHDLSKLLFIFCMNSVDCLDSALRDRFDIIYVPDYNDYDKLHIFKNYMLPKALETVGMKRDDVIVSDNAISKLLKSKPIFTLRTIEKIVKNLVGKINMYQSVLLPDGTVGDLELCYSIPNFKIPLKIDSKLFLSLIEC